jgi:hypothetical protein
MKKPLRKRDNKTLQKQKTPSVTSVSEVEEVCHPGLLLLYKALDIIELEERYKIRQNESIFEGN